MTVKRGIVVATQMVSLVSYSLNIVWLLKTKTVHNSLPRNIRKLQNQDWHISISCSNLKALFSHHKNNTCFVYGCQFWSDNQVLTITLHINLPSNACGTSKSKARQTDGKMMDKVIPKWRFALLAPPRSEK